MRIDSVALGQMMIATVPALIFVAQENPRWGGIWVYVVLLAIVGHRVLMGEPAKLAVAVVGSLPVLMLLREYFSYNLMVVIMAGALAFWCAAKPRETAPLWTNVHMRWMLVWTVAYWLVSLCLTWDYTANLRILEMAFSAALVFLLAIRRSYLRTALLGVSLNAIVICIALWPFGDRLGMASIAGHRIGNPITLAIPLALGFTLSIADRGRWLGIQQTRGVRYLFSLLLAALLLFTTSRGGVGIAAGCVLLLLCLGRGQRLQTIGIVGTVVMVVPLMLFTSRGEYLKQWYERTVSTDRTLVQQSSGRTDQWLLFPRILSASPVWGHGPGLGAAQYAQYSVFDDRIEYRSGEAADWHSLYLQLGVEAGLIGLLSIAVLLSFLLIACSTHLRSTAEIVPLLGLAGFVVVTLTVSGMDAVSGIFLGLAFTSMRISPASNKVSASDCKESILHLTRFKTRGHLEELMAIDKSTMGEQWSAEHWLLNLPEKWDLSWIAMRRNRVVGFLVASRRETAMHIHRFATATKARSQGLGSLLLEIAAREAQTRGCTITTLKVDACNEHAIRFYAARGFSVIQQIGRNIVMRAQCSEVADKSLELSGRLLRREEEPQQ
jgi:ribosomal protein S18 acetylase RimI-like enzyme/O-antigen ligase